jgi:hypothetical protein
MATYDPNLIDTPVRTLEQAVERVKKCQTLPDSPAHRAAHTRAVSAALENIAVRLQHLEQKVDQL